MSKKKWEMSPDEIAEAAAKKENVIPPFPPVDDVEEQTIASEPNVVSNTEEIRIPEDTPQIKRKKRAALELQLSKLCCRHCNSTGNWKVIRTAKTLRYLSCGVCSRSAVVFSNLPITKTLRESDLKKAMKDLL